MTIETSTPLFGVYDMEASVRFYRDLLGFSIIASSPEYEPGRFHWCMLRLGGTTLMLNTNYEFDSERPVPPDARRHAAHGDTALYINCPEVDAAVIELRGKGITISDPADTWYGARQASMQDPDGYGLVLQWAAQTAPVQTS